MHGNADSLNRLAFSATAHCLTGCAIGEVLGLVIGTALGWGNVATIALAVALAFFFGYSLTMLPLLRSGMALGTVLPLAFAADTLSITVMEIVDNAVMLVIPGAMEAGLGSPLFWGALRWRWRSRGRVPGQPLPHRPRSGARGRPPIPRRGPRAPLTPTLGKVRQKAGAIAPRPFVCSQLPKTHLLRTRVNKRKGKGRGCYAPTLSHL